MKAFRVLLFLVLASTMVGCASYSGVARVGKNKVVVLRNDGLLFGLLRKAMVCDASGSGVSNCQEKEQP